MGQGQVVGGPTRGRAAEHDRACSRRFTSSCTTGAGERSDETADVDDHRRLPDLELVDRANAANACIAQPPAARRVFLRNVAW